MRNYTELHIKNFSGNDCLRKFLNGISRSPLLKTIESPDLKAKLFYISRHPYNFLTREQHNVIDALMTGAANALKICGYLIANLIAFISVLHFLDVTISWLFNLVHHPEVNFQYILGLLFYPFAVIIGVSFRDCLLASKLIGIKVSLNEVIIDMYCFYINNLFSMQ